MKSSVMLERLGEKTMENGEIEEQWLECGGEKKVYSSVK
jgi:hypothetical protein